MTIAVLTRPSARPRPRPGLRHGLMAGASLVLHVVVLGSMVLLAADEDHIPLVEPLAPIIQLEIERPPLPPQWRPRPQPPEPLRPVEPLPQTPPPVPREVEALQPPPRPVPLPAPAPAPIPAPAPTPVPAPPKPLPVVHAAPAPTPIPAQTLTRAPVAVPAPIPPQNLAPVVAPPVVAPVAAPKPAPAPPAAAAAAAPSLPAPALPARRPAKDKDEEEAARAASAASGSPSAPAPRMAVPAPGGAPAPAASGVTDAWRVSPEGQAGRNARALRTSPAGCPSTAMLTRGEQAVCDERFNARAAEGAERPITGSGNAQRDARFAREGAREMQRYEAQRRPLSGGAGVMPPQDCPGSNFGTGCAGAHLAPSMRQGATTNVKQDSNKPD